MAVTAAIASAQVGTDAPPSLRRIGVVAGMQDRLFDIAEDVLHRIVIGTGFGQRDPVQAQGSHTAPGASAFSGMGRVLIQNHPDRLGPIPPAHLLHEGRHLTGVFPRPEGPMDASRPDIVEDKQVEQSVRLLVLGQDQFLGRAIALAAIGLDGDHLNIHKEQHPVDGQMTPGPPNAGQNRGPLGINADQPAADLPPPDPPFLSTRAR